MITLYTLKPKFQALLRPLVGRIAAAGITANQVTIASALGSIAVGAAVTGWSAHKAIFLLLPVWLFVRMALNAADGMLAREFGQKSNLGAYLNELGDVVSDTALFVPFAMLEPFGTFMVGLVIVLAILTEFVGIMGLSRRYDGPMGKSDRALVVGALGLWIGIGGGLPAWSQPLMILVAALLVVTIFNRIRSGLRERSQ